MGIVLIALSGACPAIAIEWCEGKPDGRIIDDLKDWRLIIDSLENPIHRVFYEMLLFTGLRKTEVLTLQWE